MFEENEYYHIIVGDCLESLTALDSESVECCVTSPPYFGLRDYGTRQWVGGDANCPHFRTSKMSDSNQTGQSKIYQDGIGIGDAIYKKVCPLCGAVRVDSQIGLEETPKEYIDKLVKVFHEVKRVLKEDGTLWINIGDTYFSSTSKTDKPIDSIKSKDIIGIHWMLAFALREDGWYLRQDIIWHKQNPMPESVKDRCTKSHEYIFLLSKSPIYYFDSDAIQEDATQPTAQGMKFGGNKYGDNEDNHFQTYSGNVYTANGKRNKRDVWSVPVGGGYTDGDCSHYATYPEQLIEPCILAGSRENGIILDPFSGTATTGAVALKNNRRYIGLELSDKFADISKRRLSNESYTFKLF